LSDRTAVAACKEGEKWKGGVRGYSGQKKPASGRSAGEGPGQTQSPFLPVGKRRLQGRGLRKKRQEKLLKMRLILTCRSDKKVTQEKGNQFLVEG